MSSKQGNQNLTDIELKDHGNKLFAARKFEDAIGCYTKAIVSFFVATSKVSRKVKFSVNHPIA